MNKGTRGEIVAMTLALVTVSAVGLAAMGVAGEAHVAVAAASAARSLP